MKNITHLWIWAAKNTITEFKTNKYPTFNQELHDRFKYLMEAWHQSKMDTEEAYVNHGYDAADVYEELIIEYAKILKKEQNESATEEQETVPVPF